MVTSKQTIEKIKSLIKSKYAKLAVSVIGLENLPKEMADKISSGDKKAEQSLMNIVYNYNYRSQYDPKNGSAERKSLLDKVKNGVGNPKGEAHSISYEHLNANMLHLIEKHQNNVISKLEGLIRDNNNDYKFDALQNLDRASDLDKKVKQSTIPKLKRELRDASKDIHRDWTRVVTTEVSNAIGFGSADRIVADNKNKSINNVYVYRINPNDAATCKYCRKFYIGQSSRPKLYKLSTLLNNGSNYGKKATQWKPVPGATHPNCRDSQLIELKPGFRLLDSGEQEYMGLEGWPEYISSILES